MDRVATSPGRGPVKRSRSSFSTRDLYMPVATTTTMTTTATTVTGAGKTLTKPHPATAAAAKADARRRSPRIETSTLSPTTSTSNQPLKAAALGPKDERPEYPNSRDSLTSIRDDPFFRHYQSPQSVSLARELRSVSTAERRRQHDHRARSVVNGGQRHVPGSLAAMDINIAVLGGQGVGKSTLIQKALGLRSLPAALIASEHVPLDKFSYHVTLIELELELVELVPGQRIRWPTHVEGQAVPRVDGILLLYDVMNAGSTAQLHQKMTALVGAHLPTVLVSTKCDNPESARVVDVEHVEASRIPGVESVRTAVNVPESARLCLSIMLRSVLDTRKISRSDSSNTKPRTRAISTADIEEHSEGAAHGLSTYTVRHNRSSSEYSGPYQRAASATVLARPMAAKPSRLDMQNLTTSTDRAGSASSAHRSATRDGNDLLSSTKSPLGRAPAENVWPSASHAMDKSFLDMDESDADSLYRYSDDTPILQRSDDNLFEKPAKVVGVTFDELVDRLLAQPLSKADQNFTDIFLCLYRKFAAPAELFNAIVTRLDQLAEDKNVHYLTRTSTQLRIITIVAKWIASYPGDFANPATHQSLNAFISNLSTDPIFATAAHEIRGQIHGRILEDDDTGWARSDADAESTPTMTTAPQSPAELRRQITNDMDSDLAKLKLVGGEANTSRKSSVADSTTSPRAPSPAESLSTYYYTVEDYEREARTMVPRPTLSLTKYRYHMMLGTPDVAFAREMTRIDWVMFSSTRLRDFVRHVSLSLSAKERCNCLANIDRMIAHFNHVAKWVANMILIRDKAKHRALMLEKFMKIALELRILNNYNGLAAVLAGINGTAIHRLAATRALVPTDVQKRFARNVLLMGTQKSHFAYRLAWENSPLPRIPFIPLLRRDLVSAEEGSRTFVGPTGDRVNWRKFEILSEVIMPIMRSQAVPYANLGYSEGVREMILNCDMPTDDEDIYQRSLHVESAVGASETGKKKFPWFQRTSND